MDYTGGITLQVTPHLAMVCDHSNANMTGKGSANCKHNWTPMTLKILLHDSKLCMATIPMHHNNQWIVVFSNIHCSHTCSTVAVQLTT